MDLSKLLEGVKNLDDYMKITIMLNERIADKSKKLNVQLNMSTAVALTAVRSFEIEYFNKYHNKGAAFLGFEILLQQPSSNKWNMMEKNFASLLSYWLEAVRQYLLDRHIKWWSFLKHILKLIRLLRLRVRNSSPSDILMKQLSSSLLALATNKLLSAEQAYQTLHTLNLCLSDSSSSGRSQIADTLQEHFLKLSPIMASCGYYPLQYSVLECFLKFLTKRADKVVRVTAAKTWLPTAMYRQEVVSIFTQNTWRVFNSEARYLLNTHNASSDKVTSVKYDKLNVGTIPGTKDYWLDLNCGTRCLTMASYDTLERNWNTLTVNSDSVVTVQLSRMTSQLTVTININPSEPPKMFPSSFTAPCTPEVLQICLARDCDTLKVDKALRSIFADKYQVHPELAVVIANMERDRRRKRSGVIMGGEMSRSYSPSSASTTSLAQLPEKLAALPPVAFDKKWHNVATGPQLSNVTELSENDEIADSCDSSSSLKNAPKHLGETSFRKSRKYRDSQSDDNTASKHKNDNSAEDIRSDDDLRRIANRRLRDVKLSELLAVTRQADQGFHKKELERMPLNTDNITDLLVEEALRANSQEINDNLDSAGYKNDDDVIPGTNEAPVLKKAPVVASNVKSPVMQCKKGENGSPVQESCSKIEKPRAKTTPNTPEFVKECSVIMQNTPKELIDKLTGSGKMTPKTMSLNNKVTPKKSTQKITKSSTSDESNTSAISNTPMTYVTVRTRNLKAQEPVRTMDEIEESREAQDFFTSHVNDITCNPVSPTHARRINETSSECSDDLDTCLIYNQNTNVNVEQFHLDVDVMECVTSIVDKVCELEKVTLELAELEESSIKVISEVKDVKVIDNTKNITKTKKGKRGKQKCVKPKKTVLKIKFKSLKKDSTTVNESKMNKLVLESAEQTIENEFRGTVTGTAVEKNSDKECTRTNLEKKSTPTLRRQRKLYSPKDDHTFNADASTNDSDDDQPLNLLRKDISPEKETQQNKVQEKRKSTTPVAACYKEIEKDRKKFRSRRLSKSLSRKHSSPLSPKTKKSNEVFDSLKSNIEGAEKIRLVDKKSDKDLAVFNFTSDSEDEDFKNKKIELQNKISGTTITSKGSTTTRRSSRTTKKTKTKEKSPDSTNENLKPEIRKKRPVKRSSRSRTVKTQRTLEDERLRNAVVEDLNTSLIIEKQHSVTEELVPKIIQPELEAGEDIRTTKPKKHTKKNDLNTTDNENSPKSERDISKTPMSQRDFRTNKQELEVEIDAKTVKPKKPTKKKDLIKSDVVEHSKSPQTKRARLKTPKPGNKRSTSKSPKLDIIKDDTEGTISPLPGLVVEMVEPVSHNIHDADDSICTSNLLQKVTNMCQNEEQSHDTTQNLLLDEDIGSPIREEEINTTNVMNISRCSATGSQDTNVQLNSKRYLNVIDLNSEIDHDDSVTQCTTGSTKRKSLTLKKGIVKKREDIKKSASKSPRIPFVVLTKEDIHKKVEKQQSREKNKLDEVLYVDDEAIAFPVIETNREYLKPLDIRPSNKIDNLNNKDSHQNDDVIEVIAVDTNNDEEIEKSISTEGITGHGDTSQTPPQTKGWKEQFLPRELVDMDPELKQYSEKLNEIITDRMDTDEEIDVFIKVTPKKTSKTYTNTRKSTNKMPISDNPLSEEDPYQDKASFQCLPSLRDSDSELEICSSVNTTKQPINVISRPETDTSTKNQNVFDTNNNSGSSILTSSKIRQYLKPKKAATNKENENVTRKSLVSPIVGFTDSDPECKNLHATQTEHGPKTIESSHSSNDNTITNQRWITKEITNMKNKSTTLKIPEFSKDVVKKTAKNPIVSSPSEMTSNILGPWVSSPDFNTDNKVSPSTRISKSTTPHIRKILSPSKNERPVIQNNPFELSPGSRQIIKNLLGKSPESSPPRNITRIPSDRQEIKTPKKEKLKKTLPPVIGTSPYILLKRAKLQTEIEEKTTTTSIPILQSVSYVKQRQNVSSNISTPSNSSKRTDPADTSPDNVKKYSNTSGNVKTRIKNPSLDIIRTTEKPPLKRSARPEGEIEAKRRKTVETMQSEIIKSSSLRSVDEWLRNCELSGREGVPIATCLEEVRNAVEERIDTSLAELDEYTVRNLARICVEKQKLLSEWFAKEQQQTKEIKQKISNLLQENAKWSQDMRAEIVSSMKQLDEEHLREERAKRKTLQKEMKEHLRTLLDHLASKCNVTVMSSQ